MSSFGALGRETRGAVFVEQLIAFGPVLVFGLAVWQLIELCVGDLVVRRAAAAAARAAVVVLPDDPYFYEKQAKHVYGELRKTDIELAAALVLATNPHFRSKPVVTVGGEPEGGIDVSPNASVGDKTRALGGLLLRNPGMMATGVAGVMSENRQGASPHGTLTVKVDADYECLASWVNFVCGGSKRRLTATVAYPYQGAGYRYGSEE